MRTFKKMLSFINLPCGHVMTHKNYGPDRFSRFDVYWIQTNKQTPRQTSQIYILNTWFRDRVDLALISLKSSIVGRGISGGAGGFTIT